MNTIPSTQRRDFLKWMVVSGAGAASAGLSLAGLARRAEASVRLRRVEDDPKRSILILGGTGFLGPACTEAALARGFAVTLFNRGLREQRRKDAGRPSTVPDGVEVLYGNRDPNKTADDWKDDARQNPKALERDPASPKGLSSLESAIKAGRTWDAVVDTSGYFPRVVKASAELLAPAVKTYIFVSSISVYAKQDEPITEATPVATLDDPNTEEFGADYRNYGPGKAACERAADGATRGRACNIRPGFIVGPRDTSSRFMYWPVRVRRGGEVVVPGTPEDPIQVIDVRDLAEWIVRCAERRTTGTFNATGPATPLSMKGFVEGIREGVGAKEATFAWIPSGFIEAHEADAGEFPLYVTPGTPQAGMHRTSCAKAIEAGLTFRPIADTARATLAWYDSLPPELQKGVATFTMTPEREAKLLAAWKERR